MGRTPPHILDQVSALASNCLRCVFFLMLLRVFTLYTVCEQSTIGLAERVLSLCSFVMLCPASRYNMAIAADAKRLCKFKSTTV